jgi:hypothetical protein
MRKFLPTINILAYVATLVVNFLSQSSSVLGIRPFPNTVAELGESRALFFLPAGYVFSIWGIIYLGLGAYVIYLGRAAQRDNPMIDKIGWWFLISSIGNITWLALFLYDLVAVSTIAMFVILVSLIMIYLRLGIGRTPVSSRERWFVHIPFSIYLGWITVATVANIAAMLYVGGSVNSFLGITADVWAVIMMLVATALALILLFTRRDIAYALVVVWAVFGIYARPFDTPVFDPVAGLNAGLVDTTALIVPLVILGAIGVFWFTRRKTGPAARTA